LLTHYFSNSVVFYTEAFSHTASDWKNNKINKIATVGNSASVLAVLETFKSVAIQQFLKPVSSPSSHNKSVTVPSSSDVIANLLFFTAVVPLSNFRGYCLKTHSILRNSIFNPILKILTLLILFQLNRSISTK
jgi:uncharacterized membrane protein YbjE (DUF340 family)